MEYKMGTAPAEWKPAPRVCRCCLSEGCYKDISTEYYWLGEKEMYSQMLKECFDLTISLSEAAGNSRLICEVCITRLRDASNFKKQVINSEKRFAEHLRSGASLSVAEVQETPVLVDIKVEGVKDEAAISDDDPDPVDDDIGDPDYDESDDLPLKFEVQKKESMTELSFGDEIPALNTSETTIRKVSSRTKEKSALKKLKMNKKELTIKPVKASTSKKKDKEAKVKLKATKPGAKKGPIYEYLEQNMMRPSVAPKVIFKSPAPIRKNQRTGASRKQVDIILENSNAVPFRTGMSSLSCAYCGDLVADPELLRSHTREKHKTYNPVSIFYNLKKDQLVKVDVMNLQCKICAMNVRDLSDLKVHLKDVHGKPIDLNVSDGLMPFSLSKDDWRCYLCSHRFLSLRSLNCHMGEHFHNYICDSCGRGFMFEHELATHARSHGASGLPSHKPAKRHELPHRCCKCPERFKTHDARVKHMTTAHGMEQKLYKCLECPMTFKRRSGRHVHMQTAHNCGNNFACPHCAAMFVTKTKRDEHVARHVRDKDRLHECAVCGKVYVQRKSLREHMKLHARSHFGTAATLDVGGAAVGLTHLNRINEC